jgi:hypothetical protein
MVEGAARPFTHDVVDGCARPVPRPVDQLPLVRQIRSCADRLLLLAAIADMDNNNEERRGTSRRETVVRMSESGNACLASSDQLLAVVTGGMESDNREHRQCSEVLDTACFIIVSRRHGFAPSAGRIGSKPGAGAGERD